MILPLLFEFFSAELRDADGSAFLNQASSTLIYLKEHAQEMLKLTNERAQAREPALEKSHLCRLLTRERTASSDSSSPPTKLPPLPKDVAAHILTFTEITPLIPVKA